MGKEKGKIPLLVTFKDLIFPYLCTDTRGMVTNGKPGSSIWFYIGGDPPNYATLKMWDSSEWVPMYSNVGMKRLIIYPTTKPGFMIFKLFYAPFHDKKYYLNKNFDDILQEVKKQITAGMYQTLSLPPLEIFLRNLRKGILGGNVATEDIEIVEANLNTLLKYCLTMYSTEFLTSRMPEAIILLKYFGHLIDTANRGDRKQREDAIETLSDIFKAKTIKTYGNEKKEQGIPRHLYLRGLYEYLLKIAEKDNPKKSGLFSGNRIESAQRTTKKKLSRFFSYTLGSFEKLLEKEKKHIENPETAPKAIVRKVS